MDLRRDPRLVVHSTLTDRHDLACDFKLYGTALDVRDPERRAAYRATVQARIDWAPAEPHYHVVAGERSPALDDPRRLTRRSGPHSGGRRSAAGAPPRETSSL